MAGNKYAISVERKTMKGITKNIGRSRSITRLRFVKNVVGLCSIGTKTYLVLSVSAVIWFSLMVLMVISGVLVMTGCVNIL